MRKHLLSVSALAWEIALAVAIQQKLLDMVPKTLIALGLSAPPLIFFSTRDTMQRCVKRRPRMSLLLFIIVFALVGSGAWFIVFKLQPPRAPDSAAQTDKAISDLGDRITKLSDALAKSPSVDPGVQLSILKNEHETLSKKREELTKQEKEALDNQALTLQSLEEGRRKHLELEDLARKERDVKSRQSKLEWEQRQRQWEEADNARDTDFSNKYIPVADYAITTLYEMLRNVSEQSGQKIVTDFPNDRASVFGSNMLQDGKIVQAQHMMRVGSNSDWEFALVTAAPVRTIQTLGRLTGSWHFRTEILTIKAGSVSVTIRSDERRPEVLKLSFATSRDSTGITWRECPLNAYQKPIADILKELIQNRYNSAPLNPKQP
jgi:hypothetical protein